MPRLQLDEKTRLYLKNHNYAIKEVKVENSTTFWLLFIAPFLFAILATIGDTGGIATSIGFIGVAAFICFPMLQLLKNLDVKDNSIQAQAQCYFEEAFNKESRPCGLKPHIAQILLCIFLGVLGQYFLCALMASVIVAYSFRNKVHKKSAEIAVKLANA